MYERLGIHRPSTWYQAVATEFIKFPLESWRRTGAKRMSRIASSVSSMRIALTRISSTYCRHFPLGIVWLKCMVLVSWYKRQDSYPQNSKFSLSAQRLFIPYCKYIRMCIQYTLKIYQYCKWLYRKGQTALLSYLILFYAAGYFTISYKSNSIFYKNRHLAFKWIFKVYKGLGCKFIYLPLLTWLLLRKNLDKLLQASSNRICHLIDFASSCFIRSAKLSSLYSPL